MYSICIIMIYLLFQIRIHSLTMMCSLLVPSYRSISYSYIHTAFSPSLSSLLFLNLSFWFQ